MEDIKFKKVEAADRELVEELAELAAGIIKEHYDPIIGAEQNDYMIAEFQTPEAILEQLKEGYHYYFVRDAKDKNLGFLAFLPENMKMYLSKFYLLKEQRGRGLSRKMLQFVIDKSLKRGLDKILLHVNKNNDALLAYESIGFERIGERKKDIGNGFYMDDYIYQYMIKEEG